MWRKKRKREKERDKKLMAESETSGSTTRRMIAGSQRPPPLDSAAILTGGLTLTSPAGSLTFLSSPFADPNYYISPELLTSSGLESRPSFSQLLAGAMDSPAAIPFESLCKDASFRDYSTEKGSDFGSSHQLFSGSGSVFSPAFFSTSAPANVTAQTAFAQSRPTANELTVSHRVPATDAFQYQPHAHKRTHNSYSVNADKPADDGYNWRKYGQKPVKGCEYPRSYYKCTSTGCPVKKKVERSSDGQITQIIYKGQHNHGKPQNRRGRDTGSFSGFGVGSNMDPYQVAGSRESDYSEERRNGWYVGDDDGDDDDGDDDDDGEEDGDGRASKISEIQIHFRNCFPNKTIRRTSLTLSCRKIEGHSGASTCHRTVTEPKIIVQTRSEVDLLDDGYRWRKYGQKVVKGNPHPRSYYKCTTVGCTVRKHIERAATDSKAVMTTYEGKHNHDVPAARASSNGQKVKPPADGVSLLNNISFGNSGRGSMILRLKEEKITVR